MRLKDRIKEMLLQYKKGKISVNEVVEKIAFLGYEKVFNGVVDVNREIRKNVPEVVYCKGKTERQIIEIVSKLYERHKFVIATRLEKSVYSKIKQFIPQKNYYYEEAKILFVGEKPKIAKGYILIITAGSSDVKVAKESEVVCRLLGNKVKSIYDVGVAGLHRLKMVLPYIKKARVIIVIAGMDGVLPSVIGGMSKVPVVAVPTSTGYGANFNGIAPLLTMLNSCSPGVAVVNIDNGFGAGYLASIINQE